MEKRFIEKTLSSLVEQQMNVSNTVMNRTTFSPSSNYNNHVNNKKSYNERGPTFLGDFVLNVPKKQNVAFHNWEEYKRLGLKWGEPIVIVKIKDNSVFYLEYTNGSYEEKGIDYPLGDVRWTIKRNFDAILDALASQKLSVKLDLPWILGSNT